MDKVIKLYKGENIPFPKDEQIVTSDFVYSAKRMGGAPTITCTVRFQDALDDSLDDTVYTKFNGEKFYLRGKPTTSLSNTDVRYKYDIEFISERVVLDNVYFLDVVDDPTYKGASNSTKFTFYGHIGQFAERLNYALQYSHLDYVVVVDEGVTSEEKNLSFTDQFFSNVLQEIYNTYELPYYFEGKEIHIGTAPMDKHLANIFEYGADKNLLSITKQSANNKIVNRITGMGSSENIPYYYPNSTPLGEVELFVRPNGTSLDERNFKISNPELIASRLGLNETVKYTKNPSIKLWSLDAFYRITDDGQWIRAHKEEIQENVIDYWRFTGENIKGEKNQKESTVYRIKFEGTTSGKSNNELSMTWEPDKDNNPFTYADNHTDFNFRLFENFKAYEKTQDESLQSVSATIDGDKSKLIKIPFNGYTKNGEHKFEIQIEYTHWGMPSYTGMRRTDFRNIGILEGGATTYYWVKESGIRANDIEYFGLETDGEYVTDKWVGVEVGVKQKLDKNGKPKYITPSPNLMPSIYRNSWGVERFYNAINDTYKNQDGEYYVFTNPYVKGFPNEHIESFDDIKPTINGITNAKGQPFNQFLDIAFDKDDNDSLNENNELVHPYFYVKLPKYNGEYGFNLFDCLNEKGEMTFSMTSGQLGGCNFKIAVDKNTNKNDIQVDANGNLVYNEDGRVAIGSPQQRQNDTSANEVWIALFKDTDTYPSVMPNNGASNKPSPKDTFVILNITFPEQYIRAAEKRLDDALIQFMYDNNVHKFNFSVSLSRIYFEENPEILGKLSENASVLLTYQGHTYRLFVSSFTYKMSGGSILPEISVELADTLSVSHSAADNIINAVKMNVASTISSLDVVGMASQSFLKKETDDQAQGRITFNKGLVSHGSASFGTFVPETSGVGIYQDERGNWHFETDYMRVRKKLSATSVEIEEAHHVGGQQLLTSANAAIDYVVERDTFYRCYFLKQDSTGKTVYNKWRVQDQAYCRFFNVDEGDNIEDHYYWRKVVATSNETKDDTVSFEYDGTVVITSNYHFVDLSKTECDAESDAPRVSDNIVQLGYQGNDEANKSRQNAIILAGAGDDSPYIRQYTDINKFELPAPDTQIKPGENVFTGRITIKKGSTGLNNFPEWKTSQENIEQAKANAEAAKDAAESAKSDASEAKDAAKSAQNTLDSWADDEVISPLEKQGVKDEKAFVVADKNDIDKQSERYGIKKTSGSEQVYTTFASEYSVYLANLDTILNATTDVVVIPDNMSTNQTAYYNARTSLLARIAEVAKKVADDAQTTATNAQNTANAVNASISTLNATIGTLGESVTTINRRLDGVIENYFFEGDPTDPNNPNNPALKWTTENDKANHLGDTYTNIQEYVDDKTTPHAGKSWRWTPTDEDYTGYHWHPIADSDAVKALLEAKGAKDLADGKRRIFVNAPTVPYDVGDMWAQGADGDIKVCTNKKIKGQAFDEKDWEIASKYTDNTELNNFLSGTYKPFIDGLMSGSQNLVRNSGFTGSYKSINLQNGQSLQSALEMYSPSLEGWEHKNAGAEVSSVSQTGKQVSIYNSSGYISQKLSATIKPHTNYVVSFMACCGDGKLKVTFGDITKEFPLTSSWETYHWRMTTSAPPTTNPLNLLKFWPTKDKVQICDIIVSEGTVPIDWSPSPYDNEDVVAKFQTYEYLKEVLKVPTDLNASYIQTGLVNTGMVLMGNVEDGVLKATTAGLSGIYNNGNDVAFFAGGDLQAAITAAQTYIRNPAYQPSEEELKKMANAVITHGGRAILNQAIVRGDIYAYNGYFKGKIEADSGYFKGTIEASAVYTKMKTLVVPSGQNIEYVIGETDGDPIYPFYTCEQYVSQSYSGTIILPLASKYLGMELSFLPTRRPNSTIEYSSWTLLGAVNGYDEYGSERLDPIMKVPDSGVTPSIQNYDYKMNSNFKVRRFVATMYANTAVWMELRENS